MDQKTRKQMIKGEAKATATPAAAQLYDDLLTDVTDLMRGAVRSPLGTYPERDSQVKAVWRSAE
jgi:hypothetical protein